MNILLALFALWQKHPQLRFGQLVDAFSGTCTHDACGGLFFIEDRALLTNLRNVEMRIRLEMETPR